MPAPTSITTIEELLALPEDRQRHELLDGEHVVTPAPAPRHQVAVAEFFRALGEVLWDSEGVLVLTSPADIVLGPRTLVQPDLFVVRRDQAKAPRSWRDYGIPLLAIEIVSPSTAAHDRTTKRRLYLEAGVEEYWIVDPDGFVVERWRRGETRPVIEDGILEWSLSVGVAGIIDLPAVFQRIDRA